MGRNRRRRDRRTAVTDGPSRPAVILSDRQDLPVDTQRLTDLAVRTLEGEGQALRAVALPGRARRDGRPPRALRRGAGAHRRWRSPRTRRPPGAIAVCWETWWSARRWPARQGQALDSEVGLLVVHGILHLLGYDHEEEDERRAMWERQEAYSGVRVP